MTRLSRPQNSDNSQLIAARELLAIHAERRVAVQVHDGHLTALFYSHGIPVSEIAEAYQTPASTIYALLQRQAVTDRKTTQSTGVSDGES